MKILVIQLARLGDLLTTQPVIRALKRKYPEAEVDIVVRKKFSAALYGLPEIDFVHHLDTKEILGPALVGEEFSETLIRMRRWVGNLKARNYDQVINLSFSPFSSYLCRSISQSAEVVRGYSRFDDGHLELKDDMSAYFYAQVGVGRDNRIHLGELFAEIAQIQYQKSDWQVKNVATGAGYNIVFSASQIEAQKSQSYIVVHVGASQIGKTYDPHKWQQVISRLLDEWDGHVVLVGAKEELETASKVMLFDRTDRVINLVGKTSFAELFQVIADSRLMVGCDSAPLHIAALTETRCLNLSFASVNFWETGPRTIGSRVIWAETSDDLASDRVTAEIVQMLKGEVPLDAVAEAVGGKPYYDLYGYNDNEFCWNLAKAVYFAQPMPELAEPLQVDACRRLDEINQVAIEQLNKLRTNVQDQMAAQILDRADEIIEAIVGIEPSLGPLVSWYQAEKSRLGPAPVDELIQSSLKIHDRLNKALSRFEHRESVSINRA